MKNFFVSIVWLLTTVSTSFCLTDWFHNFPPPEPPLEEFVDVAKRAYCPAGGGDKNAACGYWKKLGYCSIKIYQSFIKKTCPASCGWCQPRPTPPPVAEIVTVNQRECLGEHNKKRALHGARPLVWDRSLARQATTYALELANNNVFQHSEGNGQGENLYYIKAIGRVPTCKEAVQRWYDEVQDYPFWNPPNSLADVSAQIGHFTQIVWKSTRRVGVGLAKIQRGFWVQTYVVARYTPPANYQNKFADEVGALRTSAL